MRLAKHFIAFCTEVNTLNNTGAQRLDSLYQIYFNITFFLSEDVMICHLLGNVIMDVTTLRY